MKTILAPVDFSTPSELVADTAAALAQVYAGRVILLHVVQPPMVTNDYGVGIDNLQEIIVMSEKTATKNLEKLRARLTQAGVPTEIVLHTGAPIPHILKQAADSQADFIVMGSHGHTALYDLLVGSTTHGILRSAPCPVVVLPRRKAAAA
ncbi:MAG TPA: universal stress protein [Opitutaceae bacterium]|jgi:nucleotide-binding universal stress UspA family protein|nr:universal stress protein [Opitutaceae bacterium]HRE07225.1 universal stress protein [Opitutaceae bacterium]